ncbi:hypothetical protein V2G26_013735 [Clonostachys chloroleuca]
MDDLQRNQTTAQQAESLEDSLSRKQRLEAEAARKAAREALANAPTPRAVSCSRQRVYRTQRSILCITTNFILPNTFSCSSHADRRLPASLRRQEFLDIYHDSQMILVSGETGSGKTTQIPQFILFDEGKVAKG